MLGNLAQARTHIWVSPVQHYSHNATQRVTTVQRQVVTRRVVARPVITRSTVTQRIVQSCHPVTVKVGKHWRSERSCVSHVYRLQAYKGGSRWVETW